MTLATDLVGRASELDSVDRLLAEVTRGESAALELAGEPGIGKTRLLSELAARADARGYLVLSGRAGELELDLPFWVFVDALDEYVHGLAPQRLNDLDDDVRAELATVFPSLAGLASGHRTAIQHERYRSHRAVCTLLEALAQSQPVALVLDDVHWADPASVELLGALLHRPPAARVLVALAVRPRQMSDRLSATLERAQRARAMLRIELAALSPEDARELIGDGADATSLYEESGGNPFYLEQLARFGDRPEIPAPAREPLLAGVDVPPAVVAALAEELSLLTKPTRLILEGAAVAGDPFDPELAATAAGASDAAAIDALDELLQLDLIRETDVPRRFRFRHPLVRRAVYESMPGGSRLIAHERCADALARRGAQTSAIAHHIERSARQGDEAAVGLLQEAGEAAAARAPASAARWFAAALRLLPAATPEERRVELVLARSEALAATGQLGESHAALLQSINIVPKEAESLRVRLAVACARVEHLLGRYNEAHAHLEAALAELQDAGSAQGIELMLELVGDSLYHGDYNAMRDWAGRAVDAAELFGDQALLAAALAGRALASAVGGRAAEGLRYAADAATRVDSLADSEIGRRLDALAHLATAEFYLENFAGAGTHAERALRIGRTEGNGDLFPLIVPMLGGSLWVRGRMAEAGEVLDGAIAAARLVDNPQGLAWNLFNRSYAAFAAGDIDLALATAKEAFDLAQQLDPGPVPAHAAVALAYARFETGHAERCAELLVEFAGGNELRLIGGGWRARYLELLTRAFLEAGRRGDAEHAAAAAHACAKAVGLPMAGAMSALAAAALDLDDGKPAAAAERALSAAAALEQIGNVFDAATSRLLAGRALAQAGAPEQAAAELELAASAFESFGSHRYRLKADQELRKLGRSVHRRTRPGKADGSGFESLTERELQIARLIVDRKTNPQIAAELFLSTKTVETHLRNTFRKLGVGSRVEVARLVERADREP
jgi:ATP/maltotriose-dependent transcriptional regulator MalT